jgi:hypothetical protein
MFASVLWLTLSLAIFLRNAQGMLVQAVGASIQGTVVMNASGQPIGIAPAGVQTGHIYSLDGQTEIGEVVASD